MPRNKMTSNAPRSDRPGGRTPRGALAGLAILALALPAQAAESARGSVAPRASSPPPEIAATAPVPTITLGTSVVALNGPWRFHTGDDPRWAAPRFDDSGWETVDLTPRPGAHDDDVGLTGYVPGWLVRGHAGYTGYAWYRLRASVAASAGGRLAMTGPPYVDSAYQIFLDGRLLGGIGDFSGAQPVVYSRRPLLFSLPPLSPLHQASPSAPGEGATVVVAIRAWMGKGSIRSGADGGGIHIAPALGEEDAIAALYESQWVEVFRGYVVDAAEALVLLLLAVLAWSLTAFERGDARLWWLGAALLFTAAVRANQPLFFWADWESLRIFDVVRNVVLAPLVLGTWTLAWRAWFRLRRPAWLPGVAGTLTLIYLGVQLFTRAWLPIALPPAAAGALQLAAVWLRLLFVALFLLILVLGLRQPERDRWLALPAMLLTGTAIFAQEISFLGVRGIWFPWGTGVSRTEYAIAALAMVLFALLLRRLRGFAAPAPAR
jgi:hypothetical protein